MDLTTQSSPTDQMVLVLEEASTISMEPLLQQTLDSAGMVPDSPLFTSALKSCQAFFIHIIGNGHHISLRPHTSLWHNNWGYDLLRYELPNLHSHVLNTNITFLEAKTTSLTRSLFRDTLTTDLAIKKKN